jgi:hypothetical protein
MESVYSVDSLWKIVRHLALAAATPLYTRDITLLNTLEIRFMQKGARSAESARPPQPVLAVFTVSPLPAWRCLFGGVKQLNRQMQVPGAGDGPAVELQSS